GDPLAHHQPGPVARHRRRHGVAGARQDGRRGGVERQSLQRVCARRPGVRGRGAGGGSRASEGTARFGFPAGSGRKREWRMGNGDGPGHRGAGGDAMTGARMLLAAVLAVGVVAAPAVAAEVLIRNATVHTVDAAGVLKGADVLVRDGRIAAVGSGLDAAGATVVDARGRPLTPGLFAGLSGLGIEEGSGERSTLDTGVAFAAPAVGGVLA